MTKIENVILIIDDILGTKRKRHIIGGVLISSALFFGGLAFTVISIKTRGE